MIKDKILYVIPARFGSRRLHGKVLKKFKGKPCAQVVYEQVAKVATEDDTIVVAVDDQKVFTELQKLDLPVLMTDSAHLNGTDRAAEVAKHYQDHNKIIIVSVDLPALWHFSLSRFVNFVHNSHSQVLVGGTLWDGMWLEGNRCKIKSTTYFAEDFYREPRLMDGHAPQDPIALGLYSYTQNALKAYANHGQTDYEKEIGLEQLRLLEMGINPEVVLIFGTPISLDTPEDEEYLKKLLDTPKLV